MSSHVGKISPNFSISPFPVFCEVLSIPLPFTQTHELYCKSVTLWQAYYVIRLCAANCRYQGAWSKWTLGNWIETLMWFDCCYCCVSIANWRTIKFWGCPQNYYLDDFRMPPLYRYCGPFTIFHIIRIWTNNSSESLIDSRLMIFLLANSLSLQQPIRWKTPSHTGSKKSTPQWLPKS